MSFRVGTVYRIAVHLLAQAQLFLRRQPDDLRLIPPGAQKFKCFLCHRARDRLRRQIKNLVPESLADRLHRRKDRRNGLPDACGCLDKQILPARNRAVYVRRQFFLSFPVCIGKLQLFDGSLPQILPGELKIRPLFVFIGQPGEPLRQLRKRKCFPKIFQIPQKRRLCQFDCIQIAVGQLHGDLCKIMLQGIDIGITHRLRAMHAHGFIQRIQIHVDPLDLINRHMHVFLHRKMVEVIRKIKLSLPVARNLDSVRPSLDGKRVISLAKFDLKRHLRMVIRAFALLNALMDTAALPHGFRGRSSPVAVINVPLPQNKLHQIPHRDLYDFLFVFFQLCIHTAALPTFRFLIIQCNTKTGLLHEEVSLRQQPCLRLSD